MEKLLFFQLVIPTWQILLCVTLAASLMLAQKVKFAVISIYLFTLFWLYHLYRGDILAQLDGNPIVVAVYSVFGLAVGGLTLYAFFAPDAQTTGQPFVGPEMANLRKALLKRIDKMETAIKEAESKAMSEVHQSEEQRLDAESRAALLQTQLEEKAEILRRKESALKELEETLNGRIVDLEDQVKQKNVIVEQNGDPSSPDTNELENRAAELQAQLLDTEDSLRLREEKSKEMEEALNARIRELESQLVQKEAQLENGDNTKALEEALNAKIYDLQEQLGQKEAVLDRYDSDTDSIRIEMEQKASNLETQLREKEQSLEERERNARQLEENLSHKINDLEYQLREKEDLLEKLKREGFEQQQIMGELEGLRAELEQRNAVLQAKEMEVRMMKESMPDKGEEGEELENNSSEKGPRKSRLRSLLSSLEKGK